MSNEHGPTSDYPVTSNKNQVAGARRPCGNVRRGKWQLSRAEEEFLWQLCATEVLVYYIQSTVYMVIMVIMPGCVTLHAGHCRSLAGEYRLPATHAVRRQAALPDTKARTTTAAKSAFRSGASEERVASCTPMLPGLANPQSA